MDSIHVYPYSRESAKLDGNLELWRRSRAENIACRDAIDREIRSNFDGMHLDKDTAKRVIERFGYDRVNWVLAATVHHFDYDGRISNSNKEWANQFFMGYLKDEIREYICNSHLAVFDGVINQARREYDNLNLYASKHITADKDYAGKVLALDPKVLRDEYKSPSDQLVLAQHGFGCDPDSRGRKVYGTFLIDGEECVYNRGNFLGVVDERFLPDWAIETAQELSSAQANDVEQSPQMGM